MRMCEEADGLLRMVKMVICKGSIKKEHTSIKKEHTCITIKVKVYLVHQVAILTLVEVEATMWMIEMQMWMIEMQMWIRPRKTFMLKIRQMWIPAPALHSNHWKLVIKLLAAKFWTKVCRGLALGVNEGHRMKIWFAFRLIKVKDELELYIYENPIWPKI